jgi:ribosome-associated translation inhibitor RaiA
MEKTKAEWEADRRTPIAHVIRGPVDTIDLEYGLERIEHATRVASGPVLRLELRLTQHQDPARHLRAFAEMHAVVNGQPVRARGAAPTMHEAIDAVAQRFTLQIERARDRQAAQHQRLTDASSWHHADRGAPNDPHHDGVFPRTPETRELVRRKVFRLERETVDEAALDLELLDHDFFLFINVATDEPNLLVRTRVGYELFQPHPDPRGLTRVVTEVRAHSEVAPVCSVAEARVLLGLQHETNDHLPFVFFVDRDRGVGAVVYRRFDGHDGLIAAD